MKRRDVLKALGVTPLAAMPGAAQAREEAKQPRPSDDLDLTILQEIIERNELPWEAMKRAWDKGKPYP